MLAAKSHDSSRTRARPPERTGSPERRAEQANPLWHRLATRIQTKLRVGAPDDPQEREADRIAGQLTGSSASPCACGGTCKKCAARSGPSVHRKETGGAQATEAPAGVASVLSSPGMPLDSGARAAFEPGLGMSLAHVRVHTGGPAAQSARAMQALAYTAGSHLVFDEGQYAPDSSAGRWLLAHELAHVVQQETESPVIRRQTGCPPRPAGEAAQSRTPGGILSTDVVTPSASMLAIQDFPVNDVTLPIGATSDPVFERFMSIAAGDPSGAIAVKGYTDCVGSAAENLSLRDQRAQTVVAAMPSTLQSRPRFSWPTSPTTDFRDTNSTPEGRAHNRAVEVSFASVPPVAGQDPCDIPVRTADIDQYMFLVRCAERRLNLTAAADTPTMVSAMRQIYYGAAGWSASRNAAWNFVITDRPWAAGTNPATQLGAHLFNALRDSQVVGGHDMGHLLTGLDAMLHPHEVEITAGTRVQVVLPTGLANEEWATWAGDVGSAAAEYAVDLYGNPSSTNPIDVYFRNFANSRDLLGNLDSFSIRASLTGLAPPDQLQHAVTLSGTFSALLMQYFRISSSALSRARTSSARNFIAAYGGVLSGNTLTNRPALETTLRPSVENFAGRFILFRMIEHGYLNTPPANPGPQPTATMPSAVTDATRLYVDFLLANL